MQVGENREKNMTFWIFQVEKRERMVGTGKAEPPKDAHVLIPGICAYLT